ncbi:MAG: beta galactosidase jelly roll domain-containing protein [Bacteroidaceae bacterium]|nr:beta galactosidase jelly roll domain-containing protein [Bacteroidaceae bacterium]
MKPVVFYLQFLWTFVLCFSAHSMLGAQSIDLSGVWQFQIDRENKGVAEKWFEKDVPFDDQITLPASMPQQLKGDDISVDTKWVGSLYDSSYFFNPYMKKYRNPGKDMKLQFFLTPDKHYVGKAWYKRTLVLPEDEAVPMYTLYLERPHITTEVWVNGEKVDRVQKSLSVPHVFYLYGLLKPGENTIAICVDNDPETVKVGQDSHSVSDQTQGDWNGIVGKIELRPFNAIDYVAVYPDVDHKTARVHVEMLDNKPRQKAVIKMKATAFNTDKQHVVESTPVTVMLNNEKSVASDIVLDMGDEMLLWDEFHPQLYRLEVEVKTADGQVSRKETVFGMRKIEIRGKMFYVNDRQILLRGTVENCDFPNTGYPPMDLDAWLKVFNTCKSYGLNHMRFHSYCPPEAAFLAADMTGFYIQPEGPSWPNHGVRLGRGEPIDTYLMDESIAIVNEYGNHPSFTFYAFGNEPAGNWVKWSTDHVAQMKEYDPRHLYCGFSVGGGWAWQPGSEYAVKAGARGLNEWTRHAPESVVNFEKNIAMYNGKDMPNTPITMPFVSHETGQWCAFPNFSEISKYKGVNKAKNFEIFRDLLRDNGMESRASKFLWASGRLQLLCYKAEIERTLRTPNYAGFQLLSLNDYSGQGTALVGVTDVFFGDKGYTFNGEFHNFCSPVVPLAKLPKFTYQNDETFEADVELSQFSEKEIKNATPKWIIYQYPKGSTAKEKLDNRKIYARGEMPARDLPVGGNIDLGHISVSLSDIKEPAHMELVVYIQGAEPGNGVNTWDFWVYPTSSVANIQYEKKTWMPKDIYVTDSLDAKAMKVLNKGGKVLICAAGKVTYGKEVVQQFTPVFWNTSWFKMRPPHTTGIYVEREHSIFDLFPTEDHSDMQWWELVNRAQVMQFTDFLKDFQPLVQSIDTWFVSRKIGMLFEANVGKGKLVMTTMDITNDLDKRIVARQMRESILAYMQSEKFKPQWVLDAQLIADLFTKVAGEVNMYTNDSPDELKPALDNSIKPKK